MLLADQAATGRFSQPVSSPISVEIFVEPLADAGTQHSAPLPPAANRAAALTAGGEASIDADPAAAPASERPGEVAGTGTAAEPVWIGATSYYAGDILSDPRSEQARVALATLTGADQGEQLCGLEAMEQVRHTQPGFRPTRLAPHALRNSFQKGNLIHAPAAAVRSDRVWYEIAYRCRLDTAHEAVVGFEYALGKRIDRQLWDELGLAPIH
ncbi:DUF930 domain-containing protein [Roseibium salinum]|nr:DUF930 domain-containing protein [Roseibium salinum]